MNLEINDKYFIVGGATSGFGKAIVEGLINEGAKVIAVARTLENLNDLNKKYNDKVICVHGDITQEETIENIRTLTEGLYLGGIVVNAGGPPAKGFLETNIEEWDNAYNSILRWKVAITKAFIPKFKKQKYGRILYIESVSVKQPVPNLVLSNSLRMAVVGFVKTLADEIVADGINVNIMAPGYHDTAAMERLFRKKSELTGTSEDEARKAFESELPIGRMGKAEEFASLALWLLSPKSAYVTGQTITHDGGLVRGVFG